MHPRLTAALIGLLAVLVATVVAVPPSTATTSKRAPEPLRYVAMGDSYSAASGVLPLAPGSPPICLRCGALAATTLGRGNPCQRKFGPSFKNTVRNATFPSLVRALRDVRKAAPNARVAILGYPWIVPKQRGRYPVLPIARGDVPYLRDQQATLNDAVRRAAKRTGSTYVNLNKVFEGHDACKPIGTRWVEPVVTSTNPVIVHPNALDERKMATRTMTVLRLG